MRIQFEDDDLRRQYVEPDFRASGFGPELIREFRKVVGFVEAANDERDLRALKARHFEKLEGKRHGQCSLRLHKKWRLIFRLVSTDEMQQVVIIEVVDYH